MKKAKPKAKQERKQQKYTPQMLARIKVLLESDTYTSTELCRIVGIDTATYYRWLKDKPEFAKMIEEAEERRLDELYQVAKNSLFKVARGYEVTETKTITIPSKSDPSKPIIKEQVTTKKHVPPNPTAIIFTLTNRDPKRWKNKHSTEVTGKDGKDFWAGLSDEELSDTISELERKVGAEQAVEMPETPKGKASAKRAKLGAIAGALAKAEAEADELDNILNRPEDEDEEDEGGE